MDTWRRRTVYSSIVLAVLMLGYAVVYDYAMSTFENEQRTFLHSLQVVVETFTTTGFGSDSPWISPELNLLVILMDLTGVALIFLALPALLFPLLEETLRTTPPTETQDLSEHVVICTYTARGETLVAELDNRGIEYVLVEPDRETAVELYDAGYTVIHADPESADALAGACAASATAVIADASDEIDASIVLAAREAAPGAQVVSVVEDPDSAEYHRLAGADTVLSPRQLVGESLAAKVVAGISQELAGAVEIAEDFEIAELSVHQGSELVGTTLAESDVGERTGANVIGAWFRGIFESPPSPDATLDGSTILLVAGNESQLERLQSLTQSGVRGHETGAVVIVGHGRVGSTAASELAAADVPYTVVDREAGSSVDVVGDATDPDVLREAGIDDARTLLLGLPNDTTTVFATLVARELNPEIEIVARAQETGNTRKLYQAGGDFVLALATVSGRMLASTVLVTEEFVSPASQVDIVRTRAPELAGQSLAEADVRAETGVTVVAVERNGDTVTELDPEFTFEANDEVLITGTDEDISRFNVAMG
ncbi:metal transporter [Halobacteriales archaeon QH_6_64_20]|nr:MAG: metal transporter [Halobacteriales archaeon QH_6_64_20]